MEPIPYFYDSIDRIAILVRPKQAFLDWANQVYDDGETFDEDGECNIYLVRLMETRETLAEWLVLNFDQLFDNELNDWYTDEQDWPQERTYDMFAEWFDVEVHSMVLDLEEGPVTKG